MELGQVNNRMKRLGMALRTAADNVQREVASEVLIGLAKATPYDTGNARINWQVVFGHKPNFSIWDAAYRPPISPKGGYQGASAGADSVMNGLPIIAAFNSTTQNSIHITNNTDYISDLNRGKSRQAPPGFVQDVIQNAVAIAVKKDYSIFARSA